MSPLDGGPTEVVGAAVRLVRAGQDTAAAQLDGAAGCLENVAGEQKGADAVDDTPSWTPGPP